MATLFEKITETKESLAEYLLKACDNPLCECNEDMCDFCELSNIPNCDCTEERCLDAIIKGLDSQVKGEKGEMTAYERMTFAELMEMEFSEEIPLVEETQEALKKIDKIFSEGIEKINLLIENEMLRKKADILEKYLQVKEL